MCQTQGPRATSGPAYNYIQPARSFYISFFNGLATWSASNTQTTNPIMQCNRLPATDGVSAMWGEKCELVGRMWLKMQGENCTGELTAHHCITHQESLCGKVLKMDHVMSTVTQAVNFITAKGLNHRQFQSFMREIYSVFGDLPYHTEMRWLSRGKVLNRVFELGEEICPFLDSKGKTPHFCGMKSGNVSWCFWLT